MLSLFDGYNLRARLAPAILALLPVGIAGSVFRLLSNNIVTFLSASVVTVVAGMVAMHLTRDLGKRVERRLFSDGSLLPTTIALRHSDGSIDRHTKTKVHGALQLGSGHTLPSAAEEAEDVAAADAIYQAAVNWLREDLRQQSHANIAYEENVGYGFRRNLLGLRPLGLGLSVALLLLAVLASYAGVARQLPLQTDWVVVATIASLLVLFWLLVVRDEWVREGGRRYARALLLASLNSRR